MLEGVINTISLLIAPILLVIAWRRWLVTVRATLPAWRNGLGLAALLIVSLNWAVAALVEIWALLPYGTPRLAEFTWMVFHLWHPLVISAVVLGLALKGRPRVLMMMAGLLMFMSWPTIVYA